METPRPTTDATTDATATPTSLPLTDVVDGRLSESGPWLLVQADLIEPDESHPDLQFNYALWAIDPNGRARLQLTDRLVVQMDISPDGRRVAVIVADNDRIHNLTLKVVKLPEGDVSFNLPLTSVETEPETGAVMGDLRIEIARAISEEDNLAWSPDGRQLAFMSAHAGTSSDLYLYDLNAETVTQLTDGPSQGIPPLWSPDGHFIIHAGVETMGTGAGATMSGVWVAPADGSPVRTLYTPPRRSGGEFWLGWANESEFIAYTWSQGYRELRLVQADTGQVQILWEEGFDRWSFDPESKTILLQASSPGNNLVMINALTQTTQSLVEATVYDLAWLPETKRFQVLTRDGQLLTVTLAGGVIAQAVTMDRLPAVSSTGVTAWHSSEGLFVQAAGDDGGQPIFTGEVRRLIWSPSGETLFIVGEPAPGRSTIYVAQAPDYQPVRMWERARIDWAVWAVPTPAE
jgi:hypothetical protein